MGQSLSRVARLLGAIVFIAAGAPAQSASVRFPIEEGEVIGRKGVGALCFPKAPLRWDRSFRPDPEEIDELIAAAFDAADISRVKGEVIDVRLSLCQPHWGPLAKLVGNPTALKGYAEVEVKWTRSAGKCASEPSERTVRSRFEINTEMRGGIVAAMRQALAANAIEASRAMTPGSNCVAP